MMPAPRKLAIDAFPADFTRTILSRCQECGECMEWSGAYQAAVPIASVPRECMPGSMMRPTKAVIYVSVRRALLALKLGRDVGSRVLTTSCGNPRCVNPSHLRAHTRSEHAARMSGLARNVDAERNRKIAEAKRASSKLTIEKVREIRATTETCKSTALRYGVNPALISRIRRGQCWPDYASPFGAMVDQLRRAA
jgi:hypothetical protein